MVAGATVAPRSTRGSPIARIARNLSPHPGLPVPRAHLVVPGSFLRQTSQIRSGLARVECVVEDTVIFRRIENGARLGEWQSLRV